MSDLMFNTSNPANPVSYRGLTRSAQIPSCAISLEDLRKLYTRLSEKATEALERHLSSLPEPSEGTEEQFEALKTEARRIGQLTVIIIGSRGEQIVSSSIEILNRELLPDIVATITFDNSVALQDYNITLLNRFRLRLDFTEPPGFNTYNPWERATPNNSTLEVSGSDTTWVTAVYETALSSLRVRSPARQWLHSHKTFNFLNWLIGFPGALWASYRVDTQLESIVQGLHPFLRGAIYIYVALLGLVVFRGILGGFRAIFPLIELEGGRSKPVRTFLGAILTSLLLALLYDVLKTTLWQ